MQGLFLHLIYNTDSAGTVCPFSFCSSRHIWKSFMAASVASGLPEVLFLQKNRAKNSLRPVCYAVSV